MPHAIYATYSCVWQGVVELLADHIVCKAGQKLTSQQAGLLRIFDVKMAHFTLKPLCCWQGSRPGERAT